jgi:cell division FtsZ-interacting protein ZapD
MLRKIRQLDFDRVQFSQASLLRIQLTIHETLCRYLDQDDPHDHELQFGTVSELLDVLEQFEAP